ncbi:MAG TPA: DMT family transporter [Alphaproteobacteria bacterium]|jgi:drug/metabolite transporter (DMT)-like permease
MSSPIPLAANRIAASRTAVVALVAGALAIAFSPIFMRLSELGPFTTAVYRLALGLPLFGLWLAAEPGGGRRRGPAHWRDAGLLSLAGLFFAGDLAAWHRSIGLTTVANATLLANNVPIFVALSAWLFWRERPTRSFAVGLVLSIAGCALLSSGGFASGQGAALAGDGLALLAAVFYSGYFLTVKRLRATFTTATIMTWTAGVGALALLPAALLAEDTFWPASAVGWLPLVGLALVSHVGGQSLITYAMAHLPAGFSALTLLLQPVGAAIFAWALFGEALGPLQMAGAAVVLLGIWCARR